MACLDGAEVVQGVEHQLLEFREALPVIVSQEFMDDTCMCVYVCACACVECVIDAVRLARECA